VGSLMNRDPLFGGWAVLAIVRQRFGVLALHSGCVAILLPYLLSTISNKRLHLDE
jgi:hypothetical protein